MFGRRGIRSAAVVVAAAMVGVLGGCGGSDSGSAGGELVIGNIGSYSGFGAPLNPAQDVVKAWAEDVNEAGGVNGRKIRLVVKDDGADPAKAVTAAKELVQKEKVVAIVAATSLVDSAWAPIAAQADVPVIGSGLPFSNAFSTDANFYPSGTGVFARTYGELAEAKKSGDKFGFLYCVEAPACKVADGLFKGFAEDLDMEVAVSQGVSASAPNYTAACQALKDAGVQTYSIAQSTDVAIRISDECHKQGLEATMVTTAGIADSSWLPHEGAQGTVSVELNFPFFDRSNEATKSYGELLQKHSLGDVGGYGAQAYSAVKLFEKALEGVTADEVTGEALRESLYAMEDETLGGLAPELNFTEGEPTRINCYFVASIQDQKWTAPNGLETTCVPSDIVEAAVKQAS